MANKAQNAIGGSTTLQGGESAQFKHEFTDSRYISLLSIEASLDYDLVANVYVQENTGTSVKTFQAASDGDAVRSENYPIRVGNAPARILCFVAVEEGDTLVFDFKNTNGNTQSRVEFSAATAGTLDVALNNQA